VLLLLLSASACVLGPPDAELTAFEGDDVLAPPPSGAVVVLGHGRVGAVEWRVATYRTANDEVCSYTVHAGTTQGGGCGPIPAGDDVFGPLAVTPQDGGTLIYGVLATAARGVVVELDGDSVQADLVSLRRAGLELHGFAVLLPAEASPTAIVATGGGGAVLERFELLPLEPVPGGPQPTPAGP
jgi:hypothetical protein